VNETIRDYSLGQIKNPPLTQGKKGFPPQFGAVALIRDEIEMISNFMPVLRICQ
jgi:hypothetical protein